MKVAAFILFIYLVGFSQAQTTTDTESTTVSPKCPAPRQLFQDDCGFVVQLNQNVVYIYVVRYNSYLVLNIDLNIYNIIDNKNKIYFVSEASTGFAGIFNQKNNLGHLFTHHLKHFDMSKVLQGNFTIAADLIDYSLLYTDKVVGFDIDTTQPGYINTSNLLQDYANTTDFKKWDIYENGRDGNTSYWNAQIKAAKALNKLFQSNSGYTVEWGVAMFYVIASEQYKKEEECQTAYIDVMIRLIRNYNSEFDSTLMNKLYNIVSMQTNMTKKEAIQSYEALAKME